MTSPAPPSDAPAVTTPDRYGRWALVVLWGTLVLTAGPALADALYGRDRPVQVVASVLAWAVWVGALGAALVPRTVTLTAVRILVPASVPVLAWAAWEALGFDRPWSAPAQPGSFGVEHVLALGTALVVTLLALTAFVGDAFVNGSSYGEERRMPLRPPALLLAGPIPLTWAACVAGALAGPLLLANEQWVPGVLASAAGAPMAWFGAKALHGLARRWVVFVPAGFVLHDPMALAEPLLMPRRTVTGVGPALADTRATDYTAGALGLAVQVDLAEPTTVTPVVFRSRPGQRAPLETVEVQSLLFAPTRPGAVLREAVRRRISVG